VKLTSYPSREVKIGARQLIESVEWSEMVNELNKRWGSVVVSCCFEKLVAEARVQFEKPEEMERQPLEAATKQHFIIVRHFVNKVMKL
jgi:hypothetical protein